MAKASIRALYGDDFKTDNIVYVAKNGNDSNPGTSVDPFLTIEAANNYAIANLPLYPSRCIVKVFPGIYEEHITNSFYRVYIVADYGISDEHDKAVIIRNTGADLAHAPIGTIGRLNLVGVSVETSSAPGVYVDGILGELGAGAFQFCKLKHGHFVENTVPTYTNFNFCSIDGKTFKFTGVNDINSFIALRECDIAYNALEILSTAPTATRTVKIQNCVSSEEIKIGGNWNLIMHEAEFFSSGKLIFDTEGFIDVYKSVIANGIHFMKDTPESKTFADNYFKLTATGQPDITAEPGVVVTIVDYSGNKQDHGLSSCLQIAGGQREVGGFRNDRYMSLQTAIDSIPNNETGTINVYENLTNLSELNINPGAKITIKGRKNFSLAFTGDIIELGNNQELNFHEIYSLSGGNMEVNGTSALLSFEGCLYVSGYITSTSGTGSMILAYFSSLVGATGHPVLNINNTDTLHVIGYSRFKGITGQPAIKYSVEADSKLKVKFSTLFHGDGGANSPIEYTGVNKIDLSMYNSALNASLDPSKFTNLIGSPNNTISPEIDF